MARVLIHHEWFTADIETAGPVLATALESDDAQVVMKSALLTVLSALAEGGRWPTDLLHSLERFIAGMRTEVQDEQLM